MSDLIDGTVWDDEKIVMLCYGLLSNDRPTLGREVLLLFGVEDV